MKDIVELDYQAVVVATARSLSCPTCRAQPGKPCMERRKGHHIKLTKRRGLHPLRIMKAEWVIDNAGESN